MSTIAVVGGVIAACGAVSLAVLIRTRPCKTCGGTGIGPWRDGDGFCAQCHGSGRRYV